MKGGELIRTASSHKIHREQRNELLRGRGDRRSRRRSGRATPIAMVGRSVPGDGTKMPPSGTKTPTHRKRSSKRASTKIGLEQKTMVTIHRRSTALRRSHSFRRGNRSTGLVELCNEFVGAVVWLGWSLLFAQSVSKRTCLLRKSV